MNHRVIEPKIFYVGNPVALVTTISPDGTVNIGPMFSTWVLGSTIVLGWEATAQTLSNLQRDGECVINFPSTSLWQQVDAIATLTGHDPPAPHKADRFTFTNDKWTPGRFTPLLTLLRFATWSNHGGRWPHWLPYRWLTPCSASSRSASSETASRTCASRGASGPS
jgi:Flavin reductase like domain